MRFTVRHLLTLTALVAACVAIVQAKRAEMRYSEAHDLRASYELLEKHAQYLDDLAFIEVPVAHYKGYTGCTLRIRRADIFTDAECIARVQAMDEAQLTALKGR